MKKLLIFLALVLSSLRNLTLGCFVNLCSPTLKHNTSIRIVVLVSLIFTMGTALYGQATRLFFSEYIEGSSNNKALEIFNGTGASVDLSGYTVKIASNGNTWSTINSVTLSGTLANNDVFVIANAGANATILSAADITSTVTYFNGNDALGLFNGTTLVDIIGLYQQDPGTAWPVAGTEGGTLNRTLIRKPNVVSGNTNWVQSAGTSADNSEWIVYPIDYTDNLGTHTFANQINFVASPNGGEHWRSGTIQTAYWNFTAGTHVNVFLSVNNGETWMILNTNPVEILLGRFAFTVPFISSSQCLIKVESTSSSALFDVCDAPFTISINPPASLYLTSPTYNKLQVGRSYVISWIAEGVSNVNLDYSVNGGQSWQCISSAIPAIQGTFDWPVPEITATTCYLRVSDSTTPTVYDWSDNPYLLCKLQLLSPNGGESWGMQATKTISWSSMYIASIRLEYSLDDAVTWQLITSSVDASSGSYIWNLPSTHSSLCRIRITDTSDSSVWDISDASFTILPPVIVTAPNGNNILTVASIYSILWSCTAEVSFVLIDYSINGGTGWSPIQASNYPASVGRYDWIVPNNPSTNCLVRVRKHDDSAVYDVSDAAFTITSVLQPPVALFTSDVTSGLEPLTVQFSDTSTPGTGSITAWLWQFGNGDSSTAQHPLYVYQVPGVYSVTLTVTNSVGMSNSLTRTDYITVLPLYPEIVTNPTARLDFGNVYLGSTSVPQPLWIRNTGTAALVVDAFSYLLASSPFAVQERSLPFSIPGGDSLCIHLVFTPQAAGTVTDSLYIHSNAQNRPVYALGLRGSGEYVPPKPPTGLLTAMQGWDMHLSWDAVTETIFDTPIVPDGYLVFYNGSSDQDSDYYFFLGFTEGLSYTHYYVGRYAPFMFYRVRAVKHYDGRNAILQSLVPGMPEQEVLRLLADWFRTQIKGKRDLRNK